MKSIMLTTALACLSLVSCIVGIPLEDDTGLIRRDNVINVTSKKCPVSSAESTTTTTSGPNGSIDWLNCGVDQSSGWQPPNVKVGDLIAADLATALKSSKSPFKACSKWLTIFERAAVKYGLPPIMLTSIAMQESSCNLNEVGGAGEQGLMQITKDKCQGAPNGNCREPNFNIDAGAKYLSHQIAAYNGNVLLAVGSYNGWYRGLTVSKATVARNTNCCTCQNNLDYLQQFFNGWMQNIDAYDVRPRLGKYFNLDVCYA